MVGPDEARMMHSHSIENKLVEAQAVWREMCKTQRLQPQ